MARKRLPGEFEQVVLLALAGFVEPASGRDVYEAITANTERDLSVAAVHITLNRLAEKGWAHSATHEPEPGAGGKPRRRYSLSPEGAEVLVSLREQHENLWGAVENPLVPKSRS